MFSAFFGYNFSSVFFKEREKFMKNLFDLEVCFMECPKPYYEWDKSSTLLHVKLERVTTNFLRGVLLYNGTIQNANNPYLLISDAKEAIVLKLSKKGEILARSFLEYDKSLEVCEMASRLKIVKYEHIIDGKKLVYPKTLSVEKEMQKFIVDKIKKNQNEDLIKYLYYLYFNKVEDFSAEKLIKSIENAPIDKNLILYKFLIKS